MCVCVYIYIYMCVCVCVYMYNIYISSSSSRCTDGTDSFNSLAPTVPIGYRTRRHLVFCSSVNIVMPMCRSLLKNIIYEFVFTSTTLTSLFCWIFGRDVSIHRGKAWTAIDRTSIIWKSDLSDKIEREFF